MKPFVFRPAQGPWSSDVSWLFVCLLPDVTRDAALGELLAGCREAMRGFPIATVPDGELRVTLAQVGDATADRIDPAQRAALLEGLRERLAGQQPFEITAGSPLAYATGALLDLEDEPLQELIGTLRAAIRELRGEAAGTFHPGVTHMTLGYAHGEASTDELARKLRRVRPSHARMRVDSVHLLEVRVSDSGFGWTKVGSVGLPGRDDLPQVVGQG
ncbi:2'-5' RNA ligase family protein [Kineosporia succinea]|uniref:2'-5' RNA ligase n=1 Tax=Kineosporia succinea TaxID=84632 RepID=A0ABT9PCI3_9ACTN|nr:2'-5' RNA ligase family protein [Kineosporia succinea]MDP9830421.1 hypothetical protein [Kineosporia succinea]